MPANKNDIEKRPWGTASGLRANSNRQPGGLVDHR